MEFQWHTEKSLVVVNLAVEFLPSFVLSHFVVLWDNDDVPGLVFVERVGDLGCCPIEAVHGLSVLSAATVTTQSVLGVLLLHT